MLCRSLSWEGKQRRSWLEGKETERVASHGRCCVHTFLDVPDAEHTRGTRYLKQGWNLGDSPVQDKSKNQQKGVMKCALVLKKNWEK